MRTFAFLLIQCVADDAHAVLVLGRAMNTNHRNGRMDRICSDNVDDKELKDFGQISLKNQITYEAVSGLGKLQKQFPTVPEVFWGIIIIDNYGGDM